MTSDNRDKPASRAQSAVSICILVALLCIASAVLVKQFYFDRPSETPSTSFTHLLPLSLTAKGPPEHFTPETLWEKINGGADFYVDAGMAGLDCQRCVLVDNSDGWLELFIYDMGERASAASVFKRREGSTELQLTDLSYESGGSVFFVHDRFYVEIRLAEFTPELAEAGMALARNFVAGTAADTSQQMGPAELFPPNNLVADSIKLKKANVFSFDGLDNVYTATYALEYVRLTHATAYVSPRESAAEARQLADAYVQFLRDNGAHDLTVAEQMPADMTVLELFNNYYIIFHRGHFMAGVNECKNFGAAQGVAFSLAGHLAELSE